MAYPACFATFAHSQTGAYRAFEHETDNRQVNFVTAKKKMIKKHARHGKPVGTATAASILGRPATTTKKNGTVRIKSEWQKFYNRLLELREQLQRQMNGLAKESAQEMAGYSLHMADSGTDNFDRDFALSLLSSDQDAVYEIEEALKRIEKNTYGVCELTGKTIPKARLEAIPWTRFTVQAQGQLERDGALRQRRLGQLGSVDSVGGAEVEADDDEPEEKVKEKE
ncbi:MAG TPA: TraR/DksA C4-type zinc finger protein [Verrucomicrobiae bacterium]